jgi:hypothetical protein
MRTEGHRQSGNSATATWLSALGLAVILVVTLWRVAATYDVFSHTVDEPAHIAAGMQFFDKGRAEGDLTHSPLARIAVAIGPDLLAREGAHACEIEREEQLAQCEGERYWRTLTAARVGTLPFLVLMLATVWAWGTWSGGPLAGFLAALCLANAPPVLAHAGLATTDAAGAATLALALFLFVLWLDRPRLPRALALGVAAALAVGTKLSAVVFLPAAVAAMIVVVRWRRRRAPRVTVRASVGQLGGALAACIVVLWAIYGFTLNPLVGPGGLTTDESIVPLAALRLPIYPLVEMMRGIKALADMNEGGLPTYFMGEIREGGWWYFFPVMFAVKTPLPFLALLACGVAAWWRTRSRAVLAAAAAAAAILAVAMTSDINIGLRHVLAIYPPASIVAGAGAAAMLGSGVGIAKRGVAVLLIGWLVLDAALAHPDYLAYFNEAARADATYFSADSDFDWGQDAKRLADELSRRGIDRVTVAMNSTVKPAKLAPVKAAELWPDQYASGWVAASIGRILDDRIEPPYLGLRWLECHRPVALIGKTILLYDIAPGTAQVGETGCGRRNLAPAEH